MSGMLLLLLPINSMAQIELDYQPKTQLMLHANLNLNNKLAINTNGANWLNSKNVIGGNVGFGVSQLLFDNFSIVIGGDITLIGYNTNYDFLSKIQNSQITDEEWISTQNDYHFYTAWNYGFSYYLSKKILNDKFNPIASFGFKKNKILTYSISVGERVSASVNDPGVRIFQQELIFNNSNVESSSFISYYIKLGLLKKQTKFNTMQFNFVYHYSPDNIGEGTFLFSNLDRESSGTLELGANYLGVEFNYGFTFFKPKRLKIKEGLNIKT